MGLFKLLAEFLREIFSRHDTPAPTPRTSAPARPEPPSSPTPATAASSPSAGPLVPSARPAPGERVRALVVDDSPTIVVMLRRMLVQNGFDVSEAGDAETGLEIARTTRLHLIFLDIVLPGMNGFEALRRLRRDPMTRGIPVIMISGNELATEQFYAQRIGADDFMKKPFSRAEVLLRSEKLLGPDMPKPPVQAPAPAPASTPAAQSD